MESTMLARLLIGFVINIAFGIIAFMKEMVDDTGFFAGVLLFTLIYTFLDWQGYVIIAVFFLITGLAIDIENRDKANKGSFELYKAKRPMNRVLGRSLAGAIFACLFFFTDRAEFKLAFVASYAEAIFDTVSTKLGKLLNKTARLITNFKIVPHGTAGAISAQGTLLGALAAFIIGLAGFFTQLIEFNELLIIVIAAFFGSAVDSFLNLFSVKKRHMPNEFINFFSSTMAGLICIWIFWILTTILRINI